MSLRWDFTVATTLTDSYIPASASSAGAAAEMAASRKQAKYAALSGSYVFRSIALETLDPTNETAVQFLNNLDHLCLCRWQEGTMSVPTNLYRSAEIQRRLGARVVWE